jgi:transposase-like protein
MRDSEKTKLSFIGEIFMPQEQKMSAEEKVKLVRQCISGEISVWEAARKSKVGATSVRRWIIAYESEGAEAFLPHDKNRVYSPEEEVT